MQNFKKDGFCVKSIFTSEELNSFSDTFKNILCMQMSKMRLNYTNDINEDIRLINSKDPNALNEVLQMIRNSS
jgi:hypothetical protein